MVDAQTTPARTISLEEAQRRLAEPGRIALVGPPGVGKTYEAQRLCHAWSSETGQRPTWVNAEHVESVQGLLTACSHAYNLEHPPPSLDALGHQLAAMHGESACLLILDGIGRVATSTPPLLRALPPQHTVLLTSRRTIPGDVHNLSLDPLSTAEAVALFVKRAEQAGRREPMNAADLHAVHAIVEALDGLPLAIEIAASRTRILPPRALLARLERSMSILQIPGPDEVRDLYRAFERSWTLLDDIERTTLAQASIFQTAFSLDDLEQVVALANGDVLDALHQLVHHSLVRVEPEAADGTARFSLYRCLRHFAAQHRDTHDRQALTERYTHWALDKALAYTAAIHTSNAVDAQRRFNDLCPELHHIQAESPHVPDRIQARLLLARAGRALPRDQRFSYADDATADAVGTELEREARLTRGQLYAEIGSVETAQEELHALQALTEDPDLDAGATGILRVAIALQREPPESAALIAQSVAEACDRSADPLRAGRAWHWSAHSHVLNGQPERALEALERARDAFQLANAERRKLLVEAKICAVQADLADYDALVADTMRLDVLSREAAEHGDPFLSASLSLTAAFRWFRLGRIYTALAQLSEGSTTVRRVGHLGGAGRSEHAIAMLHHYLGNLPAAETHLGHALEWCASESTFTADVHGDYALLEFEQGHDSRAIARLDAVDWSDGTPAHRAYGELLRQLIRKLGHAPADLPAAIEAARPHIGTEFSITASSLRQVVTLLTAIDAILSSEDNRSTLSRRGAKQWHRAIAQVAGPHGPAFSTRLLLRVLSTRLPPFESGAKACPLLLDVAADGSTVCLSAGEPTDLSRREAPRLILARLVEAHLEDPNHRLSSDDVFAAGWPGRRVVEKAAQTNVYTAIRTLRRMGLDSVLVTDEGYRLRPDITLVRRL